MDRTRFKDADWLKSDTKIIIVGAGGIGSWTALLLKKIGYDVVIIDDDIVESFNLAGQFFKISDINLPKVDALYNNIKDFTNETVTKVNKKLVATDIITPDNQKPFRIISAVDNMETRTMLYEQWSNYVNDLSFEIKEQSFFIDGRLSAEMYLRYAFTGNDLKSIEDYKTTLLKDDEYGEGVCSFKQTTHIATMLSSEITVACTNFISNANNKKKQRKIKYKKLYNAIIDE